MMYPIAIQFNGYNKKYHYLVKSCMSWKFLPRQFFLKTNEGDKLVHVKVIYKAPKILPDIITKYIEVNPGTNVYEQLPITNSVITEYIKQNNL